MLGELCGSRLSAARFHHYSLPSRSLLPKCLQPSIRAEGWACSSLPAACSSPCLSVLAALVSLNVLALGLCHHSLAGDRRRAVTLCKSWKVEPEVAEVVPRHSLLGGPWLPLWNEGISWRAAATAGHCNREGEGVKSAQRQTKYFQNTLQA